MKEIFQKNVGRNGFKDSDNSEETENYIIF